MGASPSSPSPHSYLPKEKYDRIKLTIPAPNWYYFRYREGQAYSKGVYMNDDEYFADIIMVFQKELQVLYDHGLRNNQIDDPMFFLFSL